MIFRVRRASFFLFVCSKIFFGGFGRLGFAVLPRASSAFLGQFTRDGRARDELVSPARAASIASGLVRRALRGLP